MWKHYPTKLFFGLHYPEASDILVYLCDHVSVSTIGSSFFLPSSLKTVSRPFSFLFIYSLTTLTTANSFHTAHMQKLGGWRSEDNLQTWFSLTVWVLTWCQALLPAKPSSLRIFLLVAFKYVPLIQILQSPAPDLTSLPILHLLYLDSQVTSNSTYYPSCSLHVNIFLNHTD